MTAQRARREPAPGFFDLVTLLDFEEKARSFRGNKEARIVRTFKTSAARYYQRLGNVIDSPEALIHNPQLVHHLLDQRAARAADRAARTTATDRTRS
ncbi:DUF3263 domain-containing protein [Cryobacterium cryoconiti]|uniref:DUF3263 domain-containing protein n=1 Tax=Cryobacterium cryoconiti TaxID=1259239 RepID=UPI001F545483|nr:DUF3263 domain-containing protein [Cryobacterium cryoconiti]